MPRASQLAIVVALIASCALSARGEEMVPPKPAGYFNDYAGVVSKTTAFRFNEQLAQFERETSNQVLVAVYRKMQSDSDIADYTQRVAQSWRVGQADKRNGAVLFVFIDDRKMFIQVGYGLEGVLPDITAFDITERHIKPLFRQGNYEGGLAAGIDLMMKAIRGEYKGTGKTVAESKSTSGSSGGVPCVVLFIVFVIFIIVMGQIAKRGRRGGWGYTGMGGPFIGGWGGGSSGGGWSSGSSGGGFSGFSGGGGSFGGGGGGSSW